jgi:hypothetical protein
MLHAGFSMFTLFAPSKMFCWQTGKLRKIQPAAQHVSPQAIVNNNTEISNTDSDKSK